jgi:metallo-beta-lactamase class B
MLRRFSLSAVLLTGFAALPAQSQTPAQKPITCSLCSVWNQPQAPFHIYGDTYYVGMHGLSAILIRSDKGDVLIDGDIDASAQPIADHIRALGDRLSDVKLILNSHAHSDHAGGLSELQRLTGAQVDASPWSAGVLRAGGVAKEDPQYGSITGIAPVANVKVIEDGEVVHVGPIALTAHFTPGHTPGGTSWTWKSCEKDRCLDIAYTDSVSAVSADGYKFSQHPEVQRQFSHSFAVLDGLPCDILLTPHPEVTDIQGKLQKRDQGDANAFVDRQACRNLATLSRANLQKRLASEKAGKS